MRFRELRLADIDKLCKLKKELRSVSNSSAIYTFFYENLIQ